MQRYSADPTGLLAERGVKGDKDPDGYMTAMRDKNSGDFTDSQNYTLCPKKKKESRLETSVTGSQGMSEKPATKTFEFKK